MARTRAVVLVLLVAAGSAAAAGTAAPAATAALAGDRADFDGDGRGDLVIGIPYADVAGAADAGAVAVLYGSAGGIAAGQVWHRGIAGVAGPAGVGDQFGYSVAAGDFDADGFSDLAVGAPYADVGAVPAAGAVTVLYGSRAGLRAAGSEVWHRNRPGILGAADQGDAFGYTLAPGHYAGAGPSALAIAAPGDDVDGVAGAGSLTVLFGRRGTGLDGDGSQLWHRDRPGVRGTLAPGDQLARSLAAGDFDDDGRDDLAAGVPASDVGSVTTAGAVHVLYGSGSGLRAAGDQIWHRGVAGVAGTPYAGDSIGWSVASGDFDGDGRDDLVAASPFADVGAVVDAGSATILYGAGTGLVAAGSQLWHRDSPGVEGTATANHSFGTVAVTGDFDGDGRDDLAVGVPGDPAGVGGSAGTVHVLYGKGTGLGAAGDQVWHRNVPGVAGDADPGNNFGLRLGVANVDGDRRDDLAVGVPFDDVGAAFLAGSVHLLHGSGGGITSSGDEIVHRGSPALGGGSPTAGENFGLAFAG